MDPSYQNLLDAKGQEHAAPKKTVLGNKKLIALASAACMGMAGSVCFAFSRHQEKLTNVDMVVSQVLVQTPQCTLPTSESGNAPSISFTAPAQNLGGWSGNVNGNLQIAATGGDSYCAASVDMGGQRLSQNTWLAQPCDRAHRPYRGLPCTNNFNHASHITVAINQCPGVANAQSGNHPIISASLHGSSWGTSRLTGTVHIANSGGDGYCVQSITVNGVVVMNGRFWIDQCNAGDIAGNYYPCLDALTVMV